MAKLESFGIQVGKGKYHEEILYGTALIYNVANNKISNYLNRFNLSPGKFNILMVVKHHGGSTGISQVEISKYLIVTPSNMAKMIVKLEKEGLVTRTQLQKDKRVNSVKITPKGSRLLDEAWAGYISLLEGLVAKLNLTKQKELSSLLQEWLGGIR